MHHLSSPGSLRANTYIWVLEQHQSKQERQYTISFLAFQTSPLATSVCSVFMLWMLLVVVHSQPMMLDGSRSLTLALSRGWRLEDWRTNKRIWSIKVSRKWKWSIFCSSLLCIEVSYLTSTFSAARRTLGALRLGGRTLALAGARRLRVQLVAQKKTK